MTAVLVPPPFQRQPGHKKAGVHLTCAIPLTGPWRISLRGLQEECLQLLPTATQPLLFLFTISHLCSACLLLQQAADATNALLLSSFTGHPRSRKGPLRKSPHPSCLQRHQSCSHCPRDLLTKSWAFSAAGEALLPQPRAGNAETKAEHSVSFLRNCFAERPFQHAARYSKNIVR